MFPAFHANLDTSFVSISQIKNWKDLVKKNYEVRQKKKKVLETKTSQYTNTSDVLTKFFLLGKKRTKLLENCYNITLTVTFFPLWNSGRRKYFILSNLN